jgi:hypothetical protein
LLHLPQNCGLSVDGEPRNDDDDGDMNVTVDLTYYDGKVVYAELRDGSELAGPAQVIGDRLDIFGRIVSASEVVSIEAL